MQRLNNFQKNNKHNAKSIHVFEIIPDEAFAGLNINQLK